MILSLFESGSPSSINIAPLGIKLLIILKKGISQNINLLNWIAAYKSFFPVKIINGFLNKIDICMLIMLISFSYGEGYKIFKLNSSRLFGDDSFPAKKGACLNPLMSLVGW